MLEWKEATRAWHGHALLQSAEAALMAVSSKAAGAKARPAATIAAAEPDAS